MRRCLTCSTTFNGPSWSCPSCGYTPISRERVLRFQEVADAGFEPDFFERLARQEPGYWWFEARNILIEWALRRYGKPRGAFLEIGCGTGYVAAALTRAFPSWSISASEYFAAGLEFVARRIEGATLYQIDARNLPFTAEFDAVGAFDVIEHIDDDRRVLAEVRRAVVDGGILLVTVPQHRFLWSAVDEHALHQRRYSRGELRSKMAEAGFELLTIRSFVSLLMPLMLAQRIRPKRVPIDPEAEFQIPDALNALLYSVMRTEIAAIRAGLTLPFGGSLLAVGRAA